MLGFFLAVSLAIVAASVALLEPASADGIEVRSQSESNRFPDGISFTVFAASDVEITSVRLRYNVLPDRPAASVRAQCTAGLVVNCQAAVGNNALSNLVPGAVVVYHWELEDADGETLSTDEMTAVYEDDRFEWESITDGNLTVYFYFGSEDTHRTVLRTARETIDGISQLLDTRLNFPIKIWVYTTADDLQAAVASRRTRGPDSSVRTLGEVGAADTALVSRDVDFLNIVRHELAHIVTGQATTSHIAFPGWINEGISTFAQSTLLPDEEAALAIAIRRDAVFPITSLTGSAQGAAGTVSLFYGQSGAIITFMVEELGEKNFADFVAALRLNTLDGALMEVYGFDGLGLENAWRASVGLPEIVVSGNGNQPATGAIPTFVPLGSGQGPPEAVATAESPESTATAVTDDAVQEDEGSSDLPLVVGGVLVVLAFGAGGLTLIRRRNRPAD